MSQPVRIENENLRMEVWPTIGGKVASLIDKHDNFDLLFNYPAELPLTPQYDIPYANSWYAGWDECFPAIGKGPYAGHPYDGIIVPDHGELWGLPTTAVPTKDGITTVWNGLRFGYRLTRKLYLDDSSLVADYTLVNLAPFEFRFVWAAHTLMSMTQPVEFELAHASLFQLSHDQEGMDIHQSFDWPALHTGEDFSKPATLPARKGWKLFSADPIEGNFLIRYPTRQRTLELQYSSEDSIPAYWGIWMNTGGWSGHKHFAVEPTTGRSDWIDRAIREGSAARVPAMGRVSWEFRMSVA